MFDKIKTKFFFTVIILIIQLIIIVCVGYLAFSIALWIDSFIDICKITIEYISDNRHLIKEIAEIVYQKIKSLSDNEILLFFHNTNPIIILSILSIIFLLIFIMSVILSFIILILVFYFSNNLIDLLGKFNKKIIES